MNTTLYPVAATLAWTITIIDILRVPAMRKHPSRLVAWALHLFFALIFTTGSALVWRRLDSWTGLPESNTLIAMCLVVCYSASALALLQLWSYSPDRARRRVAITACAAGAVLVAMIALFVRSDSSHHHQQSFTAWYGGSVEYDTYLFIYLTTYTTAEVEIIRMCRRYAAMITRSWLRAGLITTSLGAAIGLLYTITRLADIAAALVGVDISRIENVAELGAGVGALVVMLGLTMHQWGPWISTHARRARRLTAYLRLRPLWASFYTLDQSIAFDDHRSGDRHVLRRLRGVMLVCRDPEYYVARRVVEIRDGLLSLRPHQDPDFAPRARALFEDRGLRGESLDAAVTAAEISAALGTGGVSMQRHQQTSPAAGNAPSNLDDELAWLLKVTRHFTKQREARVELAVSDLTPTGTGGNP